MTTTPRGYAASYHTANYVAGMQAMANGRWEESLAILQTEPENSPAHVLALGNAAMALGYLERFEQAEEVGEKALAEAETRGCPHPPSHVQFARNLAEAIKRRGRRCEAVVRLGDACELADKLIDSKPAWADLTRLEKAHSLQARAVARFVIQQEAGLPSEGAEAMMEDFRAANTIYQKTPDSEEVGRAECLTNFALALGMKGDRQRAEYALLAAADIATRTKDVGQFNRIETAANQLGIPSPVTQRTALSPEQGALEAAKETRFGTAFIRYCIAAEAAIERKDLAAASRLVAAARGLEDRLDANDLEVPKLCNSAATLAELEGRSQVEIAAILVKGAHQWYARLAPSILQSDDFDTIARSLHDHFRRLARYQFNLGNAAESLVAFECGKALSLAVEIDRKFLDRVIRTNPFSADGRQINTDRIKKVQCSLGEGEVAVTLAALPPNLVAFVVRRNSIETESVAVGTTVEEAKDIQEAIRVLPDRLRIGHGKAAIPDQLIDLASRLRARIGNDVVRRFVPYAFFHRMPWRALLRDAGLPWRQLPFTTEFGLLLRHASLAVETVMAAGAVALGHGTAGLTDEIDFRDEAKVFAKEWGAGGTYREPCSQGNVRAALLGGQVMLLSCHGYIKEDRLYLQLTDGDVLAETYVQDAMRSPLLILSACFSGVYAMAIADYPLGWAPRLLRQGIRRCICARWPVDSEMTKGLFQVLAANLRTSATLEDAFVAGLEWAEGKGFDFWNQLACLEIIGRD